MADSQHSMLAVNIHESKTYNRLLIVLYSSKTHGAESPPQKIKILGNRTIEITNCTQTQKFSVKKQELGKFCPVEWTRRYIELRGAAISDTEKFFILSDRSALNATFLRNLLREILSGFNLESTLYDTHSFRIGRATDLFKAGVHIDDIKQLGRWKSNAVYNYLRHI